MNEYMLNENFKKSLEKRNYILTYLKAECFGLTETFFVNAREYEIGYGTVEIEFLLKEENRMNEQPIYRCCDTIKRNIPFDLESVTKCAEEYLNDHAVEMYALFRRRVKASKPGISYTKNQTPYYDEDRVCITIPCNILGYDVCEIIEMFDNHKITVDEEEDVVKIFQSVIFNTDIDYYGKQIEGIREHETKVIRSEYKLKKKGDTEEKEKMKDAEKSLKEFLKKYENKNEEITEKDAILV